MERALTVEEWNEDDERDGVQVLQQIVWCTVEGHFTRLLEVHVQSQRFPHTHFLDGLLTLIKLFHICIQQIK